MSQPIDEDALTKKFQKFVGFKTGKSIFRVKGKEMVRFAKALGDTNPKYVGVVTDAEGKDDYSKVVAHPAFPSCFTVQTGGALYSLDSLKADDGSNLIKNMGKLLHTSQKYDYTGCIPIVNGMKLYTEGTVTKIWVKAGLLWIETTLATKAEEKDLVCSTVAVVGIRPGGW